MLNPQRWLCALFGHKPRRSRAVHNGREFWTRCKRCGHPMRRDGVTGRWRAARLRPRE